MSTSLTTRKPGGTSIWRRDPIATLRDEMNELRARLWGDEGENWMAGAAVPSLDMSETDHAVEVRMDVPGMKAKDIDIQINNNILTIRGQREEEQEEKGKTYHRIERRSGSFSRSVSLPCAVSQDEVVADYRDGVLTVTMPKTDESESPQDQGEELRSNAACSDAVALGIPNVYCAAAGLTATRSWLVFSISICPAVALRPTHWHVPCYKRLGVRGSRVTPGKRRTRVWAECAGSHRMVETVPS